MNVHERRAWRILIALGVRETNLFGKRALDCSVLMKKRNTVDWLTFMDAFVEVVGRSGANRRHVDGAGLQVYVVTDDHAVAVLCETPECERPATCHGIYEDPESAPRFACDVCCGHGCEDGYCHKIDEECICEEVAEDVKDVR